MRGRYRNSGNGSPLHLLCFGFRIGSHIPVPGIDPRVLQDIFSQGNLLGFLDLFSGGALKGCRYLHWG